MDKKVFLIFAVMLLVTTVSALTKTGEYKGYFDVNTGDGIVEIKETNAGYCTEDWSCSYLTNCVNNNQNLVCVDCNSCGTNNFRPNDCGNSRVCGNNGGSSSSSSSGSGSSSSGSGGTTITTTSNGCKESWECSNWSECVNGEQTRVCTDENTCDTKILKPTEGRACFSDEGISMIGDTEKIDSNGNNGILSQITGAIAGVIGDENVSIFMSLLITVVLILIIVVVSKRKK